LVGTPNSATQEGRALAHHTPGNGEFDLFHRMAEPIVCASAAMTPQNVASEPSGWCQDMALGYNDIAAWSYVELPHALGCQGWFTARVSSCGVLDDALKTAEQADGAAYIEVITDACEAPPMYKKLHEHVESFYNVH
jgi:TPP-dependent 2-oxoacid decarboxylase